MLVSRVRLLNTHRLHQLLCINSPAQSFALYSVAPTHQRQRTGLDHGEEAEVTAKEGHHVAVVVAVVGGLCCLDGVTEPNLTKIESVCRENTNHLELLAKIDRARDKQSNSYNN